MLEKFKFWVSGILEDDPLPDEIKYIIFKVCVNGKFVYLEMLGLEVLNMNSNLYRPLEAQFFNLKQLYHPSNDVLIYRLTNLIEEMLDDKVINQQFNKRKVYLFYNELKLIV